MLSSKIIEHLRHQFSHAPAVGILGTYFKYTKTAAKTQDFPKTLGSLCQQTSNNNTKLSQRIVDLYYRTTKDRYPETLELFNLLKTELSFFMKVFIVVDGLDEYPEERHSELLFYLRELQPLASLLVTSRDLGNIEILFEGIPSLRIEPPSEDLHLYTEDRMALLAQDQKFKRKILDKDPSLRDSIPRIVAEKAAGMFLLVQLHMNEIGAQSTPGAVRLALGSLPREINKTYDQAMERIKALPEEDRVIALKTLSWIHVRYRYQIFSDENIKCLPVLRLVVSIRAQEETFDEEFVPDRQDITSFCAGLVTIDELGTAKFVHFSTEEYFNTFNQTLALYTQPELALDSIAFINQYCRANDPVLNDPSNDNRGPIDPPYHDDKHETHRQLIQQSLLGPLASHMIQFWHIYVNEAIRYYWYDSVVPEDVNEVETKVRQTVVDTLRDPAVFRHWRTLSHFPHPQVVHPNVERVIYSDCWQEYGIASLIVAAGSEMPWAVEDMLDQDPNIKASFIYSNSLAPEFEKMFEEAKHEAEARGELLLGSLRLFGRIYASR